MRLLALIPGRGGSKRLPRKNLLPLRGRPLIAWSVAAALDSELFERVVVTTDDDAIARAGAEAGAEVLKRPAALGADDVPLVRVAQHALAELGAGYDAFCLLMANCPLRTAADVRASYDRFAVRDDRAALMSVFGYGWSPPPWALRESQGYLRRVDPDGKLMGPNAGLLCPSGAIRWQHQSDFAAEPTWYPDKLVGFPMPWHRALDIDEREDYEAALCIAHACDHGFRFGVEAVA